MVQREPSNYQEQYAMAIDVGYSKYTNPKQREFPWYGLWNAILTKHFPSTKPFLVAPQYPLWHLDDIEPAVDSEQISFTLKRGDPDMGEIKPVKQSSNRISFTLRMNNPDMGEINRVDVNQSSDQISFTLKTNDPDMGEIKRVNQSSTTEQSLAEQSFDSVASRHGDKARVPDFAVIHLSSSKSRDWEFGGVPRIPLIVEVKKWEKGTGKKQETLDLNRMLFFAQEDAEQQARYLFTRSKQGSVLAVAACADRWTWAKLTRANNPPPSTTAERDDPTWVAQQDAPANLNKWSSCMQYEKTNRQFSALTETVKDKLWD